MAPGATQNKNYNYDKFNDIKPPPTPGDPNNVGKMTGIGKGDYGTPNPSNYIANPEQSDMNVAGNRVDFWQDEAGQTQANLAKFYKSMMQPLNFSDPQVQSIMQASNKMSSDAAAAQGLSGNVDNNITQNNMKDTMATQLPQRHEMALSALSQFMNNNLGWSDLRQRQALGLGQIGAGQTALGIENQGQLYNENMNNTMAPWQIAMGFAGAGAGAFGKLGQLPSNNSGPYYPATGPAYSSPTMYSQPAGPQQQ